MPSRKQQPWHPAPYDEAVTGAIKALHAGTANEGQQQRALKWIIEAVCGTYDLSYRPDSERVGSSRVDLQACKLEYSIVSPK